MRIVVAMSGGVDSSVAALLLKEAGHDVTGVFLRNGVTESSVVGAHQGCCGQRDACDAEEVAGILGMPFYALDHAREFQPLIDSFVADYAAGRTPNPCVDCNRDLKFGALLRFARAQGAELVATGHYARCRIQAGEVELRRGRDEAKDQSYVLATVSRQALTRARFPCGDLHKEEVRERARRAGLPVYDKAESQEICFVPSGDHRDLLRERRPDLMREGDIVDDQGVRLGRHAGAAGFTVGQRKGLGLSGGPWFVLQVDPAGNRVVVGRRADLRQRTTRLRGLNWIADSVAAGETREVLLQVRAHHRAIPASMRRPPGEPEVLDLTLAPPGESLTPGQIGALYHGDRLLGGGRFEASSSAANV